MWVIGCVDRGSVLCITVLYTVANKWRFMDYPCIDMKYRDS